MITLSDYAESGIGAIVGAGLTILGFRNMLNNIENNHHEFNLRKL